MSSNDLKLYDRSVRAAKLYYKKREPAASSFGRSMQAIQSEAYRVGWMRGYRAGSKRK